MTGPYRVVEEDELYQIENSKGKYVLVAKTAINEDYIALMLNVAFAAGAESNAKYKRAWEDMVARHHRASIVGVELMAIAHRHGLEGE